MQNRVWCGVARKLFGAAAAAVLTVTLLNGSNMQGQQTGGANAADLGLMPLPSHFEAATGSYTLKPGTHVAFPHFHNARLEAGTVRMMTRLQFESGVPLPHVPSTVAGDLSSAGIVIDVAGAGAAVQSLDEDESYSLTVTPQLITLRAATVVGAFHGMETLLQLVQLKDNAANIPAVSIEDTPRFRWRGLMIDVSRHFEPVRQVERTLDGMAMVKLNVFHWHLSDDQGFRAESKIYPKLTGVGSNGEFYTQEQMRGWLAYLAKMELIYPQWLASPMWWVMAVGSLTAGTVFLMWLGEQIDKHGIGNGASMIIMAGILARMPTALNRGSRSDRVTR